MKEKSKLFEYRKTEKLNINKQSKNEYSLKYDTNYILNRRKSFQIPRTSLNNKIKYKKLEFNEEANEDINKYSPFSYCKEKATEIEKEINKIYKTMLDVRATIKETISNGIKQETSYVLQ